MFNETMETGTPRNRETHGVRAGLWIGCIFAAVGAMSSFDSPAWAQGQCAQPNQPTDVSVQLLACPSAVVDGDTAIVRVMVRNFGPEPIDVAVRFTQHLFPIEALPDADGDGWVDALEEGLGSDPFWIGNTPEAWVVPGSTSDGLDNDLDGQFDGQDFSCVPQGEGYEGCCGVPDCPVNRPAIRPATEAGPRTDRDAPGTPPVILTGPGKDMGIDSGHGRGGNYDWSDIVKKGNDNGFASEASYTSHRSEVKEHVKGLDKGDIWIFEGHGNDCDGDGTVDGLVAASGLWGWGGGRAIHAEALQRWLSDNPPSLALLSACKSSDLFDEAKAAGVKVVVGFTKTVMAGNAVAAEKAFMCKLFDGGTLNEAIAAGQAMLDKNPFNEAQMTFDGTMEGAGDKKLSDITSQDLANGPGPDGDVDSASSYREDRADLESSAFVDPDSDGDGIDDEVDDCPFDAEDFDGTEDKDGCPEADYPTHHGYLAEWSPTSHFLESPEVTVDPDFHLTNATTGFVLCLPPGGMEVVELADVIHCFTDGAWPIPIEVRVDAPNDISPGNNQVAAVMDLVCTTSEVGGEEPWTSGRMVQLLSNPGRGEVGFAVDVDASGRGRLEIFDLSGRRLATVVDRTLEVGRHTVRWDGRDEAGRELGSGAYFYRCTQAGRVATGAIVLIR